MHYISATQEAGTREDAMKQVQQDPHCPDECPGALKINLPSRLVADSEPMQQHKYQMTDTACCTFPHLQSN